VYARLIVTAIAVAHLLTGGSTMVAAVLPVLVAVVMVMLLVVFVAMLVASRVLIFRTGGLIH
jgi:hypothetical protein